jgi:CheY-like chemotaxis protein
MTSTSPANRDESAVLIVDDDPAIRHTLQELLVEEGYQVSAAGNGKEALALLRQSPALPSVILLDLRMPVMDGRAFRLHQNADPRLAPIPVVVLTADAGMARQVADLDVAAALTKPLRLEVLLSTVARYCSRST